MRIPIFLVIIFVRWLGERRHWDAFQNWIRGFGTIVWPDDVHFDEDTWHQDPEILMHMFWDPNYRSIDRFEYGAQILVNACPIATREVKQGLPEEIFYPITQRLRRPGHIVVPADVGRDIFDSIRSDRQITYVDISKFNVSIRYIMSITGIIVVDNIMASLVPGYDLDQFVNEIITTRGTTQLVLIMPEHERLTSISVPGPSVIIPVPKALPKRDPITVFAELTRLHLDLAKTPMGTYAARYTIHKYYSLIADYPDTLDSYPDLAKRERFILFQRPLHDFVIMPTYRMLQLLIKLRKN